MDENLKKAIIQVINNWENNTWIPGNCPICNLYKNNCEKCYFMDDNCILKRTHPIPYDMFKFVKWYYKYHLEVPDFIFTKYKKNIEQRIAFFKELIS